MVDPVTVVALVAVAALGGVVGAALGGYLALGALGVFVVAGELLVLMDVSLPVATPLGYSVWVGPHTVLGGGAAAAAFAVRRGYMDESYPYHPAKDVTFPLARHSKALAVGGVFGVVGAGIAWLYTLVGAPFDPVAATVVLSAFLHRIVFGYPLVGAVRGGLLDLSPYERGERREPMTDGGRTLGDGRPVDGRETTTQRGTPVGATRYVVEPFAPYQSDWRTTTALGVGVGLVSAALAYFTASWLLAFGLAAAALLAFAVREAVPVVYHVALVAGMAVLVLAPVEATSVAAPGTPADSASFSLPVALAVGTASGIVAALLGELLERVFYAHADTHFDAPFAAVFVCSVGIGVLELAGLTGTPF
ncbi:hypothetical protein [Halomarina rubra]|uniref:DUF7973 domain-containing protein n=1 Tax=Halomarina rubra TaxID=2071873 RepID=A0ABD6B190_9EURY|nr:hypothetical protein [Halomarina rubra]